LIRGQIYSLLPLTTRPPLHPRAHAGSAVAARGGTIPVSRAMSTGAPRLAGRTFCSKRRGCAHVHRKPVIVVRTKAVHLVSARGRRAQLGLERPRPPLVRSTATSH